MNGLKETGRTTRLTSLLTVFTTSLCSSLYTYLWSDQHSQFASYSQ